MGTFQAEVPGGTLCACTVAECSCTDTADLITPRGMPICGCCFGDCPDVHPEASAKLRRRFKDSWAAHEQSLAMVSEGGQPDAADDTNVVRLIP